MIPGLCPARALKHIAWIYDVFGSSRREASRSETAEPIAARF